MRHGAHRRRAGALLRKVLPRGHGFHFVRRGSHLSVPLGLHLSQFTLVRLCGDDDLHCRSSGRLSLSLEKGRAGLAQITALVRLEIVTESSSQNANVVVECLRSWNPQAIAEVIEFRDETTIDDLDRKSTRLNSSHEWNSYAVFCLKKKKGQEQCTTTYCW